MMNIQIGTALSHFTISCAYKNARLQYSKIKKKYPGKPIWATKACNGKQTHTHIADFLKALGLRPIIVKVTYKAIIIVTNHKCPKPGSLANHPSISILATKDVSEKSIPMR